MRNDSLPNIIESLPPGEQVSKYPNTFYRVSVKALIQDNEGKVLLCKENSPHWSLPGGGVDHGEEPLNALERELEEEIGVGSIASAALRTVMTVYVQEKQAWLMWIVYDVELTHHDFILGADVSAVKFIDITPFKNSIHRSEKLVYQAVHASRKMT